MRLTRRSLCAGLVAALTAPFAMRAAVPVCRTPTEPDQNPNTLAVDAPCRLPTEPVTTAYFTEDAWMRRYMVVDHAVVEVLSF